MDKSNQKISRALSMAAGFTLLEMVVGIGIFSVMMVVLSNTLVTLFGTYRDARELQRSIETAQQSINIMAKELRTSTIVHPTGAGGTSTNSTQVIFFDHSQAVCLGYRITGGANSVLQRATGLAVTVDACDALPTATFFNSATQLTTGVVDGEFRITFGEENQHIGRMTMSLSVRRGTQQDHLQTTVSFRDYGETGLVR